MGERRQFVLEAPIGRTLWSLAWPIALSNELSTLTLGVLLFWLERLIGEPGLAVESLFRPLGLMVSWFFASTSTGASVLVSRSVGAADGRGLSIAAGAVALTLALWAALAAVALPLAPQLAGLLVGDLPLDRPMLQFLVGWLAAALPAIAVAEVLLDVANATGATRFNLVRVLLDLAFMAALTPLLVEVAGIGIAGAQLAEGLGALVLVAALWRALVRARAELALGELSPGWLRAWADWRAILAIGLPMQASRMIMYAVHLVLVQLVAGAGSAGVAGYGIAGALVLFGAMAGLALAQGGAVLVGQSLGAGLADRARRGVRAALLAAWMLGALFIAITLFDRPIIGLFTGDPAIAAAAERALSILRWSVPGICTWQVLLASFAAHRATIKASALIAGGELVGLAIALVWPGDPLDAACVGFCAANWLKAALLLALVAIGALERARAARTAPDGSPSP